MHIFPLYQHLKGVLGVKYIGTPTLSSLWLSIIGIFEINTAQVDDKPSGNVGKQIYMARISCPLNLNHRHHHSYLHSIAFTFTYII